LPTSNRQLNDEQSLADAIPHETAFDEAPAALEESWPSAQTIPHAAFFVEAHNSRRLFY